MPSVMKQAEKIDKELREILMKRPSSVHGPQKPATGVQQDVKGPKAKTGGGGGGGGKGLKIAAAAVVVLLLGAGGGWVFYEMSAKKELDIVWELARADKAKNKFVDARRMISAFMEKSLSPKQKDRAAEYLKEVEAA